MVLLLLVDMATGMWVDVVVLEVSLVDEDIPVVFAITASVGVAMVVSMVDVLF